MTRPASNDSPSAIQKGEALTVWVLWLTYGSFYFCRTNIGVANKLIQDDLGLTATEMGTILAALKLSYGIGQFVNGQLAERFSARKLLALGMLCSAGLNVTFGLSTGFYFLLFVWAMNGYVQAFGWTPCMRVAGNWFPPERRGRRIGLIGTGYQVTAALTYAVSGWAAERFGWQGVFYVPAVLLTASSVHMLLFLRETPEGGRQVDLEKERAGEIASGTAEGSFKRNVLLTISNPALWCLAVSLALLNACRYGFVDWGVAHLQEVQDASVGNVAIKYMILPLGGIVGMLAGGWSSERFFGGRRVPVIVIFLLMLGCLTLVYGRVAHWGSPWTEVTLGLIGFSIYGPQLLLVGTTPVDLARGGTFAAAAGFVNFLGYMGAALGDQLTGGLKDVYKNWDAPVYFWAACAFGAAISAAFIWNAGGSKSSGAAVDETIREGEDSS